MLMAEMAYRSIRCPRVEIDGAPLPPHDDDVFYVWSGDLLSYRGPDESSVRQALRRAGDAFTLSIAEDEDDDAPLVATAVPVGPQDCSSGQTMIFRLRRE